MVNGLLRTSKCDPDVRAGCVGQCRIIYTENLGLCEEKADFSWHTM